MSKIGPVAQYTVNRSDMNIPGHGRRPKNAVAILAAVVALIGVIILSFHWDSTMSAKPSSPEAATPGAPPIAGAPAPQAVPASEPSREEAPAAVPRKSVPASAPSRPKSSSSACKEGDEAERSVACVFQDAEASTGETNSSGIESPDHSQASNRPEENSSSDASSSPELAAVRAVSKRLDALVTGSVGISAPKEVVEYEAFPLVLRISAGNVETVLESLRQDFPDNKTVVGGTTKLASRMSAQVRADGIEVYPEGEVSQAISLQEPTTWRWQAKAHQSGVTTITFTVVATPVIEGTAYPRNYYFERTIRVKVTPIGFVKQHWQWFASSIFIPIAIAVFAWMKRRRSTRGEAMKKPRRRRLP